VGVKTSNSLKEPVAACRCLVCYGALCDEPVQGGLDLAAGEGEVELEVSGAGSAFLEDEGEGDLVRVGVPSYGLHYVSEPLPCGPEYILFDHRRTRVLRSTDKPRWARESRGSVFEGLGYFRAYSSM